MRCWAVHSPDGWPLTDMRDINAGAARSGSEVTPTQSLVNYKLLQIVFVPSTRHQTSLSLGMVQSVILPTWMVNKVLSRKATVRSVARRLWKIFVFSVFFISGL